MVGSTIDSTTGGLIINFKRMQKIIIFLLILSIAISSGMVFAMAQIKEIPKPKAFISNVEGEVEIKKGDDNWISAQKDMEVGEGDVIKTDENGNATINFYDNTVSRIGPDSEVAFEELFIDEENFAKTKINLFVNTGKIWSRIIQLMDKEASFEVGSSATVATVRGTTVDFEITTDGIAKINAIDGIIKVMTVKREEKIRKIIKKVDIVKGKSATIDEKKIKQEILLEEGIVVQPIIQETLESAWFENNQTLDKKFEKERKKKMEKINKEIAGSLPGSSMYKVKKIAEKIKVAFIINPNKKQKTAIAFVNRRLAEAQQLAKEGKIALAESIINNWQKDIDKIKANPETVKQLTKNHFNLHKQLTSKIFSAIADLEIQNETDALDKKYLELKKIENKINEAEVLKERGVKNLFQKQIEEQMENLNQFKESKLQESIDYLQLKMQLLQNEKEELDINQEVIQEQIKQPIREEVIEKPVVQKEVAEQEPIQTQEIITTPVATTTVATTTATTTESVTKEPEVIEKVIEIKKLIGLIITANKYNMLVGETKQFFAKTQYSDDSTKDVTSQIAWTLIGDIGSITSTGLLKVDADGGKGTVNAIFTEDGITVVASSPEVTALLLEL